MNRGEKYRKDWQDEVNQLGVHRLHSLYMDFLIEGASEISRMSQISPLFAPLQSEISSRIAQSQRVSDLTDRLDNVFSEIKISYSNDKHLREAIGSLVKNVEKYEHERELFREAWESEVKLGRSVAKIAGTVTLGAVGLLPLALGIDPTFEGIIVLLLVMLVGVGGGFFFAALDFIRRLISSRDTLQGLLESEQFGVSGVQGSKP